MFLACSNVLSLVCIAVPDIVLTGITHSLQASKFYASDLEKW